MEKYGPINSVPINSSHRYGMIERADVVDEICYHEEETQHISGGLKLGDDVDFCITTQAVSNILKYLCSFYQMHFYS